MCLKFVMQMFVNACVCVVKAHVPGSVFTDLMRGGILQDPYFRFNDITYRHYCYLDWNYQKSFTGWLPFWYAWLLSSDYLLIGRVILFFKCSSIDTHQLDNLDEKVVFDAIRKYHYELEIIHHDIVTRYMPLIRNYHRRYCSSLLRYDTMR